MINSNGEPKKRFFKMHKASYLLIAAAIIIVASIFLSPVFSTSTSQCGTCHGGYYQYLDVLEGNAANQLPTTLTIGQTATVTVVVENSVNTATYTALSSVSLTLSSQNGHFTVSAPTYTIGTLQKGTAIATWQITAVSAGPDKFVIVATAKNSHQSISFQDTYSPASAITISAVLTPTPIPTTATTPSPAPTNTPIPTTISDASTTSTPTPSPTQTSTSGTSTTPIPTSAPNTKTDSLNSSNQQSSLKIWFTSPTEGTTWSMGNQTIEWTTTGGSGNANISLELSKLGSNGPWTTLAENLTSSNNFNWDVPNQQADYIIRATAADSTNPTQTASVTVATKINPKNQPETLTVISATAIILILAILAMFVLKKRSIQNEIRRKRKHAPLKAFQYSLYPSFLFKLVQIKVFW